jgi:hypothetical protein
MEFPTRRAVFKNPLALIGVGLVFCSLVGLVLAIGNLVSLQYTPDKLVQRLHEQYASILAQADVPTDIVQRIHRGDLIPETLRSELSKEQAQAIKVVEDHLPVLIKAVSQATEKSRRKSHIAIGVCIVLMMVGAILTARGFRQRKSTAVV